ncbi:hypothetical protein M0802_014983 [Mischocyttarus mexicanus]|nr:hypothetical protein M0802_014983 [Mischocyttarus mexicanus]
MINYAFKQGEINDRKIDKEEISDRRKNVEDIINVENIEEVKNVEDIINVKEIINVEDIIDVEEINDRRININKEVNIEEIDSREINKEVKLRKEKLNGEEINQNNFERKVGELGDGQATSEVDSNTRKPALEGKILEIIKCKEFISAKPNEATSDVDNTKGLYSKSSSARTISVYSVGRLETEWMLVSGKVGPMDVAARSSTLGGDENST